MSKLVVGVIGYRNHSNKIISNLSKNKSIKKIFSFCYKKKKIKSLNKNNKIKILQYISDLRKLGQCNSIFISSATKTHFKYLKKFINKDTYIYCEKPGPTNLKQINFLKKLPNKIKKKITKIEACIRFVKSFKEIDKIILGISDIDQLKENINFFEKQKLIAPKNLTINSGIIINPKKWKI